MPLGLILCTFSLPVGAMLAGEVALAGAVAALVPRLFGQRVNRVAAHP